MSSLPIESVLQGRDTLVVTSTGSGKPAVDEIAGSIEPGVTVVISPRQMEGVVERERGVLFLAPEQLANAAVLDQVRAAGPTLIVIDDAQCISEMGDDFQPDYLRLGAFIAEMGHPTVLALTATASPPVREEIIERLHMHDPVVVERESDPPSA
jgi:ATP-dependent DNA helicase RecQ